jgi:outer membrane protein TolC
VLDVDMAATRFLALPNGAPPSAASAEVPSSHPLLREQDAAVEESRARGAVLNRSYYPKFAVQSGLYARGTGANPDFTTGGAAAGLGPNVHNWGVGLTMSIPLMDYASLRARKQGESHRERAGQERYRQLQQDLRGQLARAQAMLQGARRIARNTPVQLEAARAAGQQAAARYKAGLAPLTEVAEAQRLLTQTEIDHSLAALQVWRGMLAVAVAQGDIGGFVAGTR